MPNYTTPLPSPRGTNYECLYYNIVRRPERMAMDAAIGGPPGSPDYADYNATDDSADLADKIYELLAGKLEPADLEALIRLIQPEEVGIAQDRGRRGIALDALMRRRVAEGAQTRARRVIAETADLTKRFPALKGARVVG
jgi:hypothetical protein